jgi:hypothetical protein
MRKLNVIIGIFILSIFFSGCLPNKDGNKEKIVKMTIYPKTGYGGYLFSHDTYGEFLIFSESDNKKKRLFTNGGVSFNKFDYKKGYKYALKAKKIWLSNPPQDGPSIRFEYLKTFSKVKAIKEDSKQEIEIEVAPKKVKFIPRSTHKIQKALFIKEKGADNWRPLIEIEGFDFEIGYTYMLDVKKVIQAEPYSVKYILLTVLSKEKQNK